jgi:serine/threonine-protein kinase
MAEIFLARSGTELGAERLVVVKQIHEALSRDAMFAQMFIEEAKLSAKLRHANVVQVLDLGRVDELLYMAMEYVEGFDLHQLLFRCSKAKLVLPADFAMFIVREVLSALDYAHRATDGDGRPLGIVHRDVSPSNVLISLEGEVKLCDFGIARAAGAASNGGESKDARVIGKSAYMSPEHARGEDLDARADVFAAGILLFELCSGKRLYRGTEEEMLELARRADIPALPERGLPEQAKLQEVLDRALAKNRDDRFASAADFLKALDKYMLSARLFASQIRFGTFLTDQFADEFIAERRARERAAQAVDPDLSKPSEPPAREEHSRVERTPVSEASIARTATEEDDRTAKESAESAKEKEPIARSSVEPSSSKTPPANKPAATPTEQPRRTPRLGVAVTIVAALLVTAYFVLAR